MVLKCEVISSSSARFRMQSLVGMFIRLTKIGDKRINYFFIREENTSSPSAETLFL